MAQLGVSPTITSIGPSGNPDIAFSNAFAVFQSPWGTPNIWQICTSFQDFLRLYGGLNKLTTVQTGTTADIYSTETTAAVVQAYYAIKGYFDEKLTGSPGVLYASRVIATSAGPTAAQKLFPDASTNNTTITAKWPGRDGATVQVTITNPSPQKGTGWALIYVTHPQSNIQEWWNIATATDAANASKKSQLVTIALPSGGQLPVTVAASKLNSGTPATADPYTATAADYIGTTTAAGVKTGLQVFNDQKLGSGFVIIPGQQSTTVRAGINTHCSSYYRHGILGTPAALTLTTVVSDLSTQTGQRLSYWWPNLWVTDQSSDSAGQILIDPVGHVAGLGARMDRDYRGPHKSPSGTTHPYVSVLDVERASNGAELVDDPGSNTLADSFINTIRLKGQPAGIVGWGMRTLAQDARFRQINCSRTVDVILLSGLLILEKYFGEDISPRLFGKVEADLNALCDDFHNRGSLYGTKPGKDPKPSDAWFAVCNVGNNAGIQLSGGELHADLSIVPTPNAEKISFNIGVSAAGFVVRQQ